MSTQILPPTPETIAFLAERLRQGDVVAIPTETVYGLAANIWNESALARVFAVKERPKFDPLICHVAPPFPGQPAPKAAPEGRGEPSASWLEYLISLEILDPKVLSDERYHDANTLSKKFWPGPLTLVLPKSSKIPDLATSGLQTLAIRAPRHPVAQSLLRAAALPLCAPSANRFGRISPTSAQDVFDELSGRIDYILDGGPCEIGLESTVVAFEQGPTILRRGGVTQSELEAVLDRDVPYAPLATIGSGQLASPGMLASHYAPRKKLFLLPKPLAEMTPTDFAKLGAPAEAHFGLLTYSSSESVARQNWGNFAPRASVQVMETLSPAGDAAEAARNLFQFLRRLDVSEKTTHLLAEPPPSATGLAAAILDRLQRAAH